MFLIFINNPLSVTNNILFWWWHFLSYAHLTDGRFHLAVIYDAYIRHLLVYNFHLWAGAPRPSLDFIDRTQREHSTLLGMVLFISNRRWNILSLFYIVTLKAIAHPFHSRHLLLLYLNSVTWTSSLWNGLLEWMSTPLSNPTKIHHSSHRSIIISANVDQWVCTLPAWNCAIKYSSCVCNKFWKFLTIFDGTKLNFLFLSILVSLKNVTYSLLRSLWFFGNLPGCKFVKKCMSQQIMIW